MMLSLPNIVAVLYIFALSFDVEANPTTACEKTNYSTIVGKDGTIVKVHLSQAQIKSLQGVVDSPDFYVSILNKTMPNGRIKTLVLLGERHLMTAEASAIGKDFMNQFREIGTEAITEGHNSIGDRLGLTTLLGVVAAPAIFYHMLKNNWTEMSLMHELKSKIKAEKALEKNTLEVLEALKSYSDEQLQDTTIEIIDDNGQTLKINALDYKNLSAQKHATTRINLEANHIPDLAENINSITEPFAFLARPVCLGLACGFALATLTGNDYTAMTAGIGSSAFGLYHFTQKALAQLAKSGVFRNFPVLDEIVKGFDIGLGRIEQRDITMAKNASSMIDESPFGSNLAIVGMMHNDGMVKMLVENHGFVAVPIAQTKPNDLQKIQDERRR